MNRLLLVVLSLLIMGCTTISKPVPEADDLLVWCWIGLEDDEYVQIFPGEVCPEDGAIISMELGIDYYDALHQYISELEDRNGLCSIIRIDKQSTIPGLPRP